MSDTIAVTLPVRTVSEANSRGHWSGKARRAKGQRLAARLLVGARLSGNRHDHRAGCVVTLTRIAPRTLDGDNLQSALKATRDGIADAIGVDDGSDAVRWFYSQRRGKPRQYAIEITIASLDVRKEDAT